MSEEQNVDIEPLVNLPNPNVANAPIVAIRGQQAIGVPNIVTFVITPIFGDQSKPAGRPLTLISVAPFPKS